MFAMNKSFGKKGYFSVQTLSLCQALSNVAYRLKPDELLNLLSKV